ncbi:hypothetical protein JYU34_001666 [Plutella xylostella]|uniref:TIL domain-containing protein n=1 Tax=Plutella xylostella TaxID=51655 RepID=A0ABQ7R4K0_PLUXY|nr:uncharacterized protein LOC105390635 [Plutella xylostella]KAG7312198.1 hypothetical protein JYU34_001666 [Plutella xylostella]
MTAATAWIYLSAFCIHFVVCRDEEKIMKACYWPHEVYEPCFAGCAEASCDNPRARPRPCYPYCEPGCVCEEPYVRDDRTHQCVLPQDCTPTQMGIPVPSNHEPTSPQHKYGGRTGHSRSRKDQSTVIQGALEYPEKEHQRSGIPPLGKYFDLVIAPPVKAHLHQRKVLKNDVYGRGGGTRLS